MRRAGQYSRTDKRRSRRILQSSVVPVFVLHLGAPDATGAALAKEVVDAARRTVLTYGHVTHPAHPAVQRRSSAARGEALWSRSERDVAQPG